MKNNDRIVETYRGRQLVAAKDGTTTSGVVWKAGKKVFRHTGTNLQDVLETLRSHVDEGFAEVVRLRTEPLNGDDYVRALQTVLKDLSDGHCAMLKAHYHAPNQTITATELAAAAGYKSYSAANLQYGNVGKALYEELPVDIPRRDDGSLIYTSAIATADEKTENEVHWTWKMRPEVAYAVEHLGLAT
jgi:hypothetical protein